MHRVPNRYRVALVIGGGGSRGMVSAGMCLGLEELGLEWIQCLQTAPSLQSGVELMLTEPSAIHSPHMPGLGD